MARKRPEVVATRVTAAEAALIRAAAIAEKLSVAEWLHRVAVPAARRDVLRGTEPGRDERAV